MRVSISTLDPEVAPPSLPFRYRVALSVLRHLEAIAGLTGVAGAVGIGWFVGHH